MKTKLSKTELKIAALISNGYLEKEIADKMCISHHTVHTHTRSIRRKWACKNIADITRVFILSLPNAADVLKVVLFLTIQLHLIFSVTDFDVRRVKRSGKNSARIVRVLKTKQLA